MVDSGYTHVVLVVDRSGSMSSVQSDAEGGVNSLVAEQYGLPGKFTLTLSEFDDEFTTVARMSDSALVYRLVPRGMTALLDAVGREIVHTGEDLALLGEGDRPGKVVFVVVTDGLENSSTEYDLEKVREMIARQKSVYGWDFQFIGAGESAWQGAQLGMATTQYSGSGEGTARVYAAMSNSLGAYRAAPSAAAVFSMPEVVDEGDSDGGGSGV